MNNVVYFIAVIKLRCLPSYWCPCFSPSPDGSWLPATYCLAHHLPASLSALTTTRLLINSRVPIQCLNYHYKTICTDFICVCFNLTLRPPDICWASPADQSLPLLPTPLPDVVGPINLTRSKPKVAQFTSFKHTHTTARSS